MNSLEDLKKFIQGMEFHLGIAIPELSAIGLWAYQSATILQYCQTEVNHYFKEPNALTREQFKELSPVELHKLHFLHRVVRRPPVWYLHDLDVLYGLCDSLGLENMRGAVGQTRIRSAIGLRLYRRSASFRAFVDSLTTGRAHPYSTNTMLCRCQYAASVSSLLIEFGC